MRVARVRFPRLALQGLALALLLILQQCPQASARPEVSFSNDGQRVVAPLTAARDHLGGVPVDAGLPPAPRAGSPATPARGVAARARASADETAPRDSQETTIQDSGLGIETLSGAAEGFLADPAGAAVVAPQPGSGEPGALAPADGQPAPLSLAMCAASKDGPADVREWVEYHLALGFDTIYLFDTDNPEGVRWALEDFIASGAVQYYDLPGVSPRTVPRLQLRIYELCLREAARKHDWMAFFDVDEFLALDSEAIGEELRQRGLPALGAHSPPVWERSAEDAGDGRLVFPDDQLHEMEERSGPPASLGRHRAYAARTLGGRRLGRKGATTLGPQVDLSTPADGPAIWSDPSPSRQYRATVGDLVSLFPSASGLAVTWRLMGSAGLISRPAGLGQLEAFTKCTPRSFIENTLVKTMVHTSLVNASVSSDPHRFEYADGSVASTLDGTPAPEATATPPERPLAELHHYALRSRAEYAAKVARGSAMGNRKGPEFFMRIDAAAVENCTAALDLCVEARLPACRASWEEMLRNREAAKISWRNGDSRAVRSDGALEARASMHTQSPLEHEAERRLPTVAELRSQGARVAVAL